jgi:hypothetical protein
MLDSKFVSCPPNLQQAKLKKKKDNNLPPAQHE